MTTKHEIGSVAKLTGLTIHNLRVWERRHQAVEPERSKDGRRLYSDKDIERLTRLKRCVNNGDRIGNIARLDDEALRERADKFDRNFSAVMTNTEQDKGTIRMGLAGMPLFRRTLENFVIENNYKVRICFGVSAISDIPTAYNENVVDCIVTEVSNITDEIADMLIDTSTQINECPIIVLHHFSRSDDRNKLELSNVWPINSLSSAATTLAVVLNKTIPNSGALGSEKKIDPTAPKPIFSVSQLSTLQQISTSVHCECPQQISSILKSLHAFDEYCANCEVHDDDGLHLHHEARHATARSRRTMEQILIKILKADGIEINDVLNINQDAI